MLYPAGAVLSALPPLFGGVWLWMLWVNVSLPMVALAYLTGNAAVLQKQVDGRLSVTVTVLLLSYLADMRLNTAHRLGGKVKTAQAHDGV